MNKRRLRRRFKLITHFFLILFFVFCLVWFVKALTGNFSKLQNYLGLTKDKSLIKPQSESNDISYFETKLKEANILISSRREDQGSSFEVVLKDGPIVLFSKEKDVDWQVMSLREILSRLTIDNKKPKKIDFRFDKPIVNF